MSGEPRLTESKAVASSVEQEVPVPPAPKVTTAYPPMMMHHPQLSITKFTGDNWTEFIEYFESVADANAWSEQDKLTSLLMSIDSKPRMYARGDKGTQQTYQDVKRRLQQRYGQNEPAFNVRTQLCEIQRLLGERLEVFADRLQEVAQRGLLDPQDRDELFYFAFLGAVKDTPKMQNYIEKAHAKNRNLKLSDLLALSQEYLNRSPTALRRTVAVNVCRSSKPVGKLMKEGEEESSTPDKQAAQHHDTTAEGANDGSDQPHAETVAELEEFQRGKNWYFNKEIDWLKKIVKGKGLHHGTGRGRGRGTGYGRGGSQDSRQDAQPGSNQYGGGREVRGVHSHAAGTAPSNSE